MAGDRCEAQGRAGHVSRGILLLLVSAVAFSTAGLFTRLAPVGLAATVLWRNGSGCLGLAILLLRRGDTAAFRLGRRGWLAAICSAFATLCYLAAFAYTSVADIAVLYATAPMLTAALAWFVLGERAERTTLVASGIALVGVAVTIAGSAASGTILGDGLALLMTVALSGVAVLARGEALPPLATAFWSAFLAGVAAVPFTLGGASLRVHAPEAIWLAIFGVVTMTLALPAYLAGAARVPAGRAMLLSAAELPLAPFWVWAGVGERPPIASLIGGAIVLVAIAFDLGQRGRQRKRGAGAPLSLNI